MLGHADYCCPEKGMLPSHSSFPLNAALLSLFISDLKEKYLIFYISAEIFTPPLLSLAFWRASDLDHLRPQHTLPEWKLVQALAPVPAPDPPAITSRAPGQPLCEGHHSTQGQGQAKEL